ncbi:MAG: response regulator [Chloroflexi bacterium]|nr:response regulator [Chloroflexota bacterium]
MRKRVLVLEDDEFISEVIAESLAPQGYQVDVISNGTHVWQYLERHRPSLILLDLSLPNEDGLTICRKIRRNPDTAKVPVVVVSALSQDRTIRAVMEAGANDFIKKPFNIEDLIAAARTYVGQVHGRRNSITPHIVPHVSARRSA